MSIADTEALPTAEIQYVLYLQINIFTDKQRFSIPVGSPILLTEPAQQTTQKCAAEQRL
jgi:hypothetical protein